MVVFGSRICTQNTLPYISQMKIRRPRCMCIVLVNCRIPELAIQSLIKTTIRKSYQKMSMELLFVEIHHAYFSTLKEVSRRETVYLPQRLRCPVLLLLFLVRPSHHFPEKSVQILNSTTLPRNSLTESTGRAGSLASSRFRLKRDLFNNFMHIFGGYLAGSTLKSVKELAISHSGARNIRRSKFIDSLLKFSEVFSIRIRFWFAVR